MNYNRKREMILLAHPSMDLLGQRIFNRIRDIVQKQFSNELDIDQKDDISKLKNMVYMGSGIKWEKFPDGFPNLFIENVKDLADKDVVFLASFHSPEVIFEQLSIIFAIPRYLARSFTLVLPYFPTGTMERVDLEGQVATAKTLAQLISTTPLTAYGPAKILIYDIHALQERFYFSDSIIPRLESAVSLLKSELKKIPNASIAFPDEGSFKRFKELFRNDVPLIICRKKRFNDKRIIKVSEGISKDRHVIIVDDLVQSGATLLECAKALKLHGASEISAFVTHAVFPKNSWKQFCLNPVNEKPLNVENKNANSCNTIEYDERKISKNDLINNSDAESKNVRLVFSNFWITDSIPHTVEIVKHKPFKLLSLDILIINTLFNCPTFKEDF